MNQSNEATVIKNLLKLKAAYPRQNITDETIDIYLEALATVDPDLLAAAVNEHINTGKWFPTVAEIKTAVANIQNTAYNIPENHIQRDQMRSNNHGVMVLLPCFTRPVYTDDQLLEIDPSIDLEQSAAELEAARAWCEEHKYKNVNGRLVAVKRETAVYAEAV